LPESIALIDLPGELHEAGLCVIENFFWAVRTAARVIVDVFRRSHIMSAEGDLTRWVSDITDPLEQFHNRTEPIESEFKGIWESFQTTMNDLLLFASGPDAFTGQAATAIHDAYNEFATVEQNFQTMNIMGRAETACHTCTQSIHTAITSTSPRMYDPVVLWEAVKIMDPGDIAKYGGEMVPDWLQWVNGAGGAINPHSTVRETLHALDDMADQIKAAVATWVDTIDAMSEESWPKVGDWYSKGTLLVDLGEKASEKFEELLKKTKGVYILSGIGILIEMVTGEEKFSWKNLYSDVVGTGLSLVPGVDVVALTGSIIQTGAPMLAWGQDRLAHAYSQGNPELEKELKVPAQGMRDGADKVDVQKVLNDVGGVFYDLTWGNLEGPIGPRSISDPAGHTSLRALGDLQRTVVDTGSTLKGAYQVTLNTVGAGVEDFMASTGKGSWVPKVNKVLSWLGA
jgi:hypothetical protein